MRHTSSIRRLHSAEWMCMLERRNRSGMRPSKRMVDGIGSPARTAFLTLLVPPKSFENAMKWRTSLGQISALAGPALGGFLIRWSVPSAYLLAAASTIIFVFVLLTIHAPPAPQLRRGNIITQVLEGIAFTWQRKIIFGTISLDLFAVLLGGAVYLMPVFARDIINLHGMGLTQKEALGWLNAAPAAGAMAMAFLLAHKRPMKRAGASMLWAVAGFGVATIVFGLSRNFWLSMAMLFLTGVFDNISVVVRHTLIQFATPNEMRGRVSAVNAIFIGSSNQLGGFE